MAKKRKSRPKTARKARGHKSKRGARKNPAPARRKAPPASDPLDFLIEAAARALALPIEPAWQPAVRANLAINLEMAAFVAAFPLADEAEPAPIFRA